MTLLDISFVSLVEGYNDVKTSTAGITLLTIAICIGVILLLKKFTVAYKRAHVDHVTGEKRYLNARHFFDLFWQYIIVFAVIMIAPVFISMLETGLGEVETQFSEKASEIEEKRFKEFKEKALEEFQVNSLTDLIPLVKFFKLKKQADDMARYVVLNLLYKYLLYIYASCHYVYLILLELVAPIAVVCALDKSTFSYFQSWVRNMIVCYLMIPALIIANLFADKVMDVLDDSVLNAPIGSIGLMLFLIVGVLLKLKVFSFSMSSVLKLI